MRNHLLDGYRVPRITIAAFLETETATESIRAAAADRRVARASFDVVAGGTKAAIALYEGATSPDLLILESRAPGEELLEELGRLAEVCDAGTKVVVIGASNDIALYRELMERGVSEYLVGPADAPAVIAAIARLYSEPGAKKLGKTYAFLGARGGVGSSSIAHNLGSTMARLHGSEVVIADMDLPFGTAGLNFNLETAQGVAEAMGGTERLDELLLDRLLAKCDDRLSLLAAPAVLDRTYDLDEAAFDKFLEVAQVNIPILVLDLPHLWNSWTRRLLTAADEVVITATPDLVSLRNTKALVDVLRQERKHDAPPRIILNQVGVPKRPEIKLADFADALQLQPIASIPFDPRLFGTAANRGQMIADISSRSSVCRAFAEVAGTLSGRAEARRRRGKFSMRGLFGRGTLKVTSAARAGS